MSISATIITYNEEKNIHDCISSVHDFCAEVLVLDSFSTDRTEEIARQFPRVRFEKHAFDGHVQQKNRALQMARHEWILCLDADERITPELARSIEAYTREHAAGSGARFKRLTMHMGRAIRHGGWYNARYRLIKKGRGAWAGENPHDTIALTDKARGPVLAGDLLHFSFIDLSEQVDTINKFSSIVAFTRKASGKRFSMLKLCFKPVSKFLETYVFKLGFLDGMPGLVIAVASSFSTFLKWAKLYELERGNIERPSNLRADYRPQLDN